MAAGKLNILIEQGADFKRKLIFKDSNNALIDLTGSSFTGQIRKSASDATIIATFSCTVLDQVTNTGEVLIQLSNTQTSAIPVAASKDPEKQLTEYAYDIERTLPSAEKERILEGIASVSPEVTKP